ncbi:MAG: hypothetical protein P4M12_11110 [Gammaproteobacteria bacterium]|nr:hypothetical protein [Gammaproteobacteria bacterium]
MDSSHDKKKNASDSEDVKKPSNELHKVPDEVLHSVLSPYLNERELSKLARVNRTKNALFQPTLSVKKVLNLVVKYELKDEAKIKAAIAAGDNPILSEINEILNQDPTLALKREHITDHAGNKHYCSPLEYAHWSGNWAMRYIIFYYAKQVPNGEMHAAEQIREWDAKAYNYNLLLIRAETNTIPDTLEKDKPALIKQYNKDGEDKIFQWGDVNGEWRLTELDDDAKKYFNNLHFPDDSRDQPILMESNSITSNMYDALKKGHTAAHFDLNEFVRATDAFIRKYPPNVAVPQALWEQFHADWHEIGKTQKKMPAWIAAIWCSEISFSSVPDLKAVIASPEVFRLKLYYGNNFYKKGLGSEWSILKLSNGQTGPCFSMLNNLNHPVPFLNGDSGSAMAALSKLIIKQREVFKQCLPAEPDKSPGQSR